MRKIALVMLFACVVPTPGGTPREPVPVVPPTVNLDARGEAGYLWSGYTPRDPGQPIAWKPREGDIVFMTATDKPQHTTYAIGRTTHPYHIGLIVRRSNGELGILESGGGIPAVTFRPILGRFGVYDLATERRFAWVRRIRQPLTCEQSRSMTVYGEPQVGKPFSSYARLTMFWLPGHPSPKTTPDQEKWFCSEIVVALLQEAGVLGKTEFRHGSTTPRELFTDCLWNDISDRYHAPLPWSLNLAQPPVPGPLFAPYRARE